MAVVALAIVASTAVGVGTERRLGRGSLALSRRLIDGMVWVLVPFITYSITAHLRLSGGVGIGLALAFVELAAVALLAYVIGPRVLRLDRAGVGSLVLA